MMTPLINGLFRGSAPMPATPAAIRFQASTPGQVEAEYVAWARCYPDRVALNYVLLVMLLGIGIGLALLAGVPRGLPILIPFLLIAARIFIRERVKFARVRRHCAMGCLTASKVVSLSPCLVAVYTGMQTGREPYPVIKITPMPLERAKGRRWQVDDRLATICLYQGKPEQGYWSDITPLAVACVTDDVQADQTALERLTASEGAAVWTALDAGLARVPRPYRPGLTWLREPPPAQAQTPQVWRGERR